MEQYEFQDSKEESPFPHLLAASYGSSFAKSANKPEKNKKCGVCGKHARTPSDLLRHLRVHTGERPFPCVACDKSFKCKRSQLTHQYLSHGLSEGLSQHRIDTLDRRPGRASSAKTVQQVPSIMEKLIQESLLARQQQQPPPTIPDQPLRASPPPQVDQDEDTEILEGGGGGGPLSFEGVLKEEPREVEQQQVVDQPPKVPVLRIKTHKCTHCKRQFRSVYTLRYHLRSMHDEKVYLSPALESRLKRRRWVPPHVRLSRKKLRMLATAHHQAREKKQEAPPAVEIKKERQDEEEEDINNNEGGGGGGKTPFVPHIFFPSGEEGLEQPVSWESLQATAECMLISKLEAVHPATQQKYVLYKCGVCGKAFASLRAACGHLALNHDVGRGRDCEKCGASFAWGGDLDAHLACHKPPPLPSYLINPFPPAAPPTLERMPHLPYPFFPVPQPGFFPFFLQPQQVAPEESVEEKVGQTFQCKLCPKTFDRIFSLQRHERIHSGQKACFCKVCGRGFSELRNLRHHIVRFHAESSQPLPYRRRPNRSSQRLVSFLKKTAVRILNSISSKEKKEDPVPPPPEQNASMPQLQEAASLPPPTTDTTTPPKLSPSATEGATVEVLRDPKRSLLGNRRKGRPFKLTPHPPEPLLFPPQGGATTLSESTLLQATEILSTFTQLASSDSLKPELSFPQLSSFFGLQPPPNEEPIDMRNPACVKREAEVEPPPPPTPAFPDNNNMGGLFEGGGKDGVDGGRLFPCSYCHKSFNSITDINRHMSFHADIRPFKCPYCSYCSRTNSQLKVHMMRHEGIKHYMCQICNYNGVTQSDLNRHLKTRTHLLRSRNVCPCCGTGFHTRSLSEEHARSCHQQGAAPTTGAAEKGGSRVTRLKQFNPSGAGAELFQKLLKQQQQ